MPFFVLMSSYYDKAFSARSLPSYYLFWVRIGKKSRGRLINQLFFHFTKTEVSSMMVSERKMDSLIGKLPPKSASSSPFCKDV